MIAIPLWVADRVEEGLQRYRTEHGIAAQWETRERIAVAAAAARRAVARLSMLLTDLKDLRRLQTGALETYLRPVDLDEVLAAALEDLGPGGPAITLSVPEGLPDVIADADLLTRDPH